MLENLMCLCGNSFKFVIIGSDDLLVDIVFCECFKGFVNCEGSSS